MPGIVCAIRGGPASRPTIAKSIQLAEETGLTLYFLYVALNNPSIKSGKNQIRYVLFKTGVKR